MSYSVNWRTRSKPNPRLRAGCLSRLLLWWMNDVIKVGRERRLEERDVYEILPEDSSCILVNDLAREWEKELYRWRTTAEASLLSALLRCYGVKAFLCGLIILAQEILKFCLIILIGELVSTFEPIGDRHYPASRPILYQYSGTDAYLVGLGVALAYIVWTIFGHARFYFHHQGLKLQSAVTGLIYRKVLTLSYHGIQEGESIHSPIRLVAVSAKHLESSLLLVQHLWLGVVDLLAVLPIMWLYLGLGLASLPGLAILLLLVPIQLALGRRYAYNVSRSKVYTAARVQLVSEVVNAIRFIKTNCWERIYSSFINALRMKETEHTGQSVMFRGLSAALHLITSKMAVFLVVMTYVLVRQTFDAKQIVVMIALLDQIHQNTSLMLTWAIQDGTQVLKEIGNIRDFLVMEERGLEEEKLETESPLEANTAVNIEDFSSAWNAESAGAHCVIRGVTLKIKKGEFLAISGPKYAGKTALLLSILGETYKVSGTLQIRGKVAYVNKAAWIFGCTLRENITFGQELNVDKYRRAVQACELTRDFERYPAHDLSEVRDSDVAPDDGLRVRLALARCVYHDLDVLLLDDPFSLMEDVLTHRIIHNCFHGLLKTKTVVLVTNVLEHLKAAHRIVLLKEGIILGTGTYSDLDTFATIPGFLNDLDIVEQPRPPDDVIDTTLTDDDRRPTSKLDSASSGTEIDDLDLEVPTSDDSTLNNPPWAQLFEDSAELVPVVKVDEISEPSWRTYLEYMALSYGRLGVVCIGLLAVMAQTMFVVCDWWVFLWSIENHVNVTPSADDATGNVTANLVSPSMTSSRRTRHLLVYFALVAAYMALSMALTAAFHAVLCRAARLVHRTVLTGVLNTATSFVEEFDTLLAKIFFDDISVVDDSILIQLFDTLQFILMYTSTLVLLTVSNPWLLLVLIPHVIVYQLLRTYFLRAARDLKVMENRAKDEVCLHVSNTMHGIRPIRYLDASEKYLRHFDARQDKMVATSYLSLLTHQWMAVRVDVLLVFTMIFMIFMAILIHQKSGLYPYLEGAYVALALLYGVRLHTITHLSTRQSSQLKYQMGSVTRLLHHTDLIPEENLYIEKTLPPLWPPYGIITFEGVTMQYEEKGLKVLRNFWCCIRAEEKVGVLRRKGVDCSSLINAIYRLVPHKGAVWIDGINLADVRLCDFRERLTLIPEDPRLFTGTLRQNMDPNNHVTDAVVWRALQEVDLSSKVVSLPLQLQTRVSSDKPIFSTAQIQQLCLARALIKQSKIVIFEETQAGFDLRADRAIRDVLRTAFKDSTVIYITQRIASIVEYDRVLILDDGRLLEYDPAFVLLKKPGIFTQAFDELPANERDTLRRLAEDKYENRPYVQPEMNKQTILGPDVERSYFRHSRSFLPSFQTSRLSSVLSNLSPTNM